MIRLVTTRTMSSWRLGVPLLLVFCCITESCITSKECHEGQYCCKSHCTPEKIRCNDLCNRDEDCATNELCVQHMCITCSQRLSCDEKTCFNNTNCPLNYQCLSGKCTKGSPSRALVSFVPFVVIIGVLGFALVILCYTEGCWKELLRYLKRRYANYGSLAREDWEAEDPDDMDEGEENISPPQRQARGKQRRREGENPADNNAQTSGQCTTRSCGHDSTQQQGNYITTDSPTTQTISNRSSNGMSLTSMMEEGRIRRGLRNMLLRELTSPNSMAICQQQQRNQSARTIRSGETPAFTVSTRTSGSVESLPSYCSLFRQTEQNEEPPPPRYEDVVNTLSESNTRVIIDRPARSTSQNNSVAETVV